MNKSMDRKSLAIIIVNWNTRQLLEECLVSIQENVLTFPVETWVVDNASTDESPRMVRECFPQVHLIENRENVGFARANNQAIQRCTEKYILLLNPDTLVEPYALQTLVDFLDTHPKVGAAGARILNPDGTLQISGHPRLTLLREFWRMFHLDALRPYAKYSASRWEINQAQEVDVLMGACLLVRKEVLDQIGHLDEDYFIYSEEVDLCFRIQRAGWQLFWVPQAKVRHFGGQSTQQVPNEMFLHLYQGKIKYFRKHHGSLAASVYILLLLTAALSRIILMPFTFFENPSRRQNHLTLAYRYWHLVRSLPSM